MRIESTPQAERALDAILSCSSEIYGKQTLKKFYRELRLYKRLLVDNPYMGVVEREFSHEDFVYRSVVIHPLFKVIYRVITDVIYIVDIWDTRRNWDDLIARLD